MRRLCDVLPDWLWPHLVGPVPVSPTATRHSEPLEDQELLDAAETAVRERLARANDRNRTTDSKLLALLGLVSILSAGVTAAFVAACTMFIDKDFPMLAVVLAGLLLLHLGVNLLRAVWCTVNGLMRRGFAEFNYDGMLPRDGESGHTYRERLIRAALANAEYNDWITNQKVSELAVAHAALRNALCSTGAIMIVSVVIALVRLLQV